MSKSMFQFGPYIPKGSGGINETESLTSIKNQLTKSNIDPEISRTINEITDKWSSDPISVEPYIEMRSMLERVRRVPPGNERIDLMNSIVRTLGQPNTLATFLDALRESVQRGNSKEQRASKEKLLGVKMHSIYGWCGNTLIVESLDVPTVGTFSAEKGLANRLGNSAAAWNLTVHIWQPNVNSKGFPMNCSFPRSAILEPPHSHPFNFSSMVVKGKLHQSIYVPSKEVANDDIYGYYKQSTLEHVDGVWPPHHFRKTVTLTTKEHRVSLTEGESYYMPCNWIHDVEIDGLLATSRPTVTLFLSSEYLAMPHVYMNNAMVDYHEKHTDIKQNGRSIPEIDWHRKLEAISAYLRDEQSTLRLNEYVKYQGEYAFFHLNQ